MKKNKEIQNMIKNKEIQKNMKKNKGKLKRLMQNSKTSLERKEIGARGPKIKEIRKQENGKSEDYKKTAVAVIGKRDLIDPSVNKRQRKKPKHLDMYCL